MNFTDEYWTVLFITVQSSLDFATLQYYLFRNCIYTSADCCKCMLILKYICCLLLFCKSNIWRGSTKKSDLCLYQKRLFLIVSTCIFLLFCYPNDLIFLKKFASKGAFKNWKNCVKRINNLICYTVINSTAFKYF